MIDIKAIQSLKVFEEAYSNTTDFNHGIHSYPAKFPPQIPAKLLDKFAKDNYVILDPFCGSGTTLVEASLRNLSSVGNDINPIALLISTVKTTKYFDKDFEIMEEIIHDLKIDYINNKEILKSTIEFPNKDHWFQKNVQKEIEIILKYINLCPNEKYQNLLKVVLSEIIVAVSNQESDTRYAAIDKNIPDGKTIELFEKRYFTIKDKILSFSDIVKDFEYETKIISNDARSLIDIQSESIDMIITSPPYANTYDYYLYHKHRMNWLGYNFKETQNTEIGSRNEYSSKKQKPEKWKHDLRLVLQEMFRVMKKDRLCFIVIGDSIINKEYIKINDVIREIATKIGFEYLNEESVPLFKNSRKFNKKFGTDQTKLEHLISLYKPN
jgi:DNA modification methylase